MKMNLMDIVYKELKIILKIYWYIFLSIKW